MINVKFNYTDNEFVVRVVADTVLENEDCLTELDAIAGDGDFGYSLVCGFNKVLAEWDNMNHSLPDNFLKNITPLLWGLLGMPLELFRKRPFYERVRLWVRRLRSLVLM